jgi:hypothetical protein
MVTSWRIDPISLHSNHKARILDAAFSHLREKREEKEARIKGEKTLTREY